MSKKNRTVKELRLNFIKGCAEIDRCRKKYVDNFSVLGIDPSRTSTGWAFRDISNENFGAIKPSTHGFSKVIYIEKELRSMLEKVKPFVCIEGYAYNARWGREGAGELGGVIRRLLYFKKCPLVAVAPKRLKSWIRAKSKGQIMLEILDQTGIKITDEDAADAFILADILYNALILADNICNISKIKGEEEVRLYFKNKEYKESLPKLKVYQAELLLRMIADNGESVMFFNKVSPIAETEE